MDTRICKVCGIEKSAIKGIWVFKHNKPEGRTCLACHKLKNTAWRSDNRAKFNQLSCAWKIANKSKSKTAFIAWYARNKGVMIVHSAKRHALKLRRTPKWLTPTDLTKIAEFYICARRLTDETKVIYHVDHIIPLKGNLVSGLHVPWNLQVIPATDNLSKGNKYAIHTS